MKKIETLYGIEVVLFIPALVEQKRGDLIMPSQRPDWITAIVVRKGIDCKKDIDTGDAVVIHKSIFTESPIITKNLFDLSVDNKSGNEEIAKGTFIMTTEYNIIMKLIPNG